MLVKLGVFYVEIENVRFFTFLDNLSRASIT